MTDEKYMIDGNVVINKLAEQTMVLELASDTLIKTVDTVKIQTDNINVIINNQLRQEQKINDLEKFIKFFSISILIILTILVLNALGIF